jgi:hypothetical protein
MAAPGPSPEKICKFLLFSEKIKNRPKKLLDMAILARARQ